MRSKLWGSVLLFLAGVVTVIELVDTGLFIGWGLQTTLSQVIADSATRCGGIYVFLAGVICMGGMLTTHFTGFVMTPRGRDGDAND